LKLVWSLALAGLVAGQAEGAEWRWRLDGVGVAASGTLTTKDTPDAGGFYEITGINGAANGVAIAGLQAPATSIPGNDGYPVDNRIRIATPQLSESGFGYALANGTYANPFYGAHFEKPASYVFISDPKTGKTSEPPVDFAAEIVSK
jgi:hypothetical protein